MPIHYQHSPGGGFGQGNNGGPGYQGKGGPGPQGSPGGFGLNQSFEDWVFIDGQEVFVGGARLVRDPVTGRHRLVRVRGNVLFDDFGMPYSAAEGLGRSWTGLVVTIHTVQWCLSPFGYHLPRKCRDLGDGGFTDYDERAFNLGHNFLCSECLLRNEKLRNRRSWFGWLGYLPDIY